MEGEGLWHKTVEAVGVGTGARAPSRNTRQRRVFAVCVCEVCVSSGSDEMAERPRG